MNERNERYDAALAHVYMYKYDSEEPRSSLRGHIQVLALSDLYRSGKVAKIFIAGGQVWGDEYPSLAEVMARELVRKSVNPGDIVINPQGMDTPQEVDLFLEEAKRQGWGKLADVANINHQSVIGRIYNRRKRRVSNISSEEVLSNIHTPNHSFRPYPYRAFLKAFQESDLEKRFGKRETIISFLYRLGFESLLTWFARRQRTKKFKPPFDK